MTSDAKFEKLHQKMKEDFERESFFPVISCCVETPVVCQVPPSLLQSLTLTHNAPGAQPWLLLFWAVIKLNAALMAVLELMSGAELAALCCHQPSVPPLEKLDSGK